MEPEAARVRLPLPWSARSSHLGGIPRRVVFLTIGAVSKLFTSLLNNTRVHNLDTLMQLVRSRPRGISLLTVSNHTTTLDDPLMWGIKGFPMDPKLARWTLAADDICFTNPILSYFFRLGKCIPITRGAGIYQPHMNEALDRLNDGDWLHTFPEGKISQENGPIRHLKWGVASLIARATVPPIVLPICHSGFEKVMPEKYFLRRRPLLPLCFKNVSIVVGEPMQFDIPTLTRTAEDATRTNYLFHHKNSPKVDISKTVAPATRFHGPDNRILQWVYSHLSEQIRTAMQDLFCKAKSLNKKMGVIKDMSEFDLTISLQFEQVLPILFRLSEEIICFSQLERVNFVHEFSGEYAKVMEMYHSIVSIKICI